MLNATTANSGAVKGVASRQTISITILEKGLGISTLDLL